MVLNNIGLIFHI